MIGCNIWYILCQQWLEKSKLMWSQCLIQQLKYSFKFTYFLYPQHLLHLLHHMRREWVVLRSNPSGITWLHSWQIVHFFYLIYSWIFIFLFSLFASSIDFRIVEIWILSIMFLLKKTYSIVFVFLIFSSGFFERRTKSEL